jgi:uncharacterized protein
MQLLSLRTINPWIYLRRLALVICGLFIMSVGIVCTYRSGLGLGPWDALHQGISRHTPLTIGQAGIIMGGLIILVGLLLKVRPGVATVLNMILIGVFIDLHLHMNWMPDLTTASPLVRLAVDALGVFLMGLGTAFYIAPRLGAGPRDGLMLHLNILTKVRIALVRAFLEGLALLIGFLLGGTIGVGTLLFALGVGPSVEVGFWLVEKLQPILKPEPVSTHLLHKGT